MSKILDQLCKEPEERAKFAQLADYFNELDLSDLNEYEDPDDLVRDVLPAHRLLMRIFVKRYLMPLRECKIDLPKELIYLVKEDGVAVRFAGLLVTTYRSIIAAEGMTIPDLHRWLLKGELIKLKLRFIDISMNRLLPSDMKYVYGMVEDLRRRNMIAPSGLILDLSCNRVHGIAQFKEEVDRCVASIVN
ncbi:hypothetical protein MP638_006784 [Amoeboaphelidium occidentale]|nr:hypothetical protein MP638_006784 [Amoeboaphelidium occidentale]